MSETKWEGEDLRKVAELLENFRRLGIDSTDLRKVNNTSEIQQKTVSQNFQSIREWNKILVESRTTPETLVKFGNVVKNLYSERDSNVIHTQKEGTTVQIENFKESEKQSESENTRTRQKNSDSNINQSKEFTTTKVVQEHLMQQLENLTPFHTERNSLGWKINWQFLGTKWIEKLARHKEWLEGKRTQQHQFDAENAKLHRKLIQGLIFEQAKLNKIEFNHSGLCDIIFNQSQLKDASFDNTTIFGLLTKQSELQKATFHNASLKKVFFGYSNLQNTVFQNVSLQEVTFHNSNLAGALFINCQMESVETVQCSGEFTICECEIDSETEKAFV